MRILIIQPWISYRGAESVSLDEAHGLIQNKHNASILCLYLDKERLKKEDRELDYILPPPVIARFCQRSNVFFFIFGFFILTLLILVKGRKYDIYNPHNFPSVWSAVIASFLWRKNVVWTVHNFPQHGFTNEFAKNIWESFSNKIDQKIVNCVSCAVCVSEKVKEKLNENYKVKSYVIYPPVNIKFFTGNKIDSKSKQFEVLIASNFHENKNPFFVVDTLEAISLQSNNIQFTFVGEGHLKDDVEKYAEQKGLVDKVFFPGFVSKTKLRNLYQKCDLFFLPGTAGEGFNISVLEALCSKLPSMVMEDSGIDTWLGNNEIGFVSSAISIKAAEKIIYLSKHKELLEKAGKKGFQIVKRYHNGKFYAEKLIDVFDASAGDFTELGFNI